MDGASQPLVLDASGVSLDVPRSPNALISSTCRDYASSMFVKKTKCADCPGTGVRTRWRVLCLRFASIPVVVSPRGPTIG